MAIQGKSRFVGRLPAVAAAALLLAGAVVFLYPGVLVLFTPHVKMQSRYCTIWKAVPGAQIKLGQLRDEERIRRGTHLVRRESGLALWTTPQGQFWVPDNNADILPILLAQGNRDIYGTAEWGVRPGDIVLDCGAYIGTYTRLALARGASRVVAIEPTPRSVECIRRNLAQEIAAGKVIVCPKGIWDSEGTLTLFEVPGKTEGNSFSPDAGAKQLPGIPVTSIDALVRELNLPRVDLIKADIKGATERMLKGGSETIVRYKPRLALSTEEPDDDPYEIADLARRIQPAYQMKCGPCLLNGTTLYTDVLFFR